MEAQESESRDGGTLWTISPDLGRDGTNQPIRPVPVTKVNPPNLVNTVVPIGVHLHLKQTPILIHTYAHVHHTHAEAVDARWSG